LPRKKQVPKVKRKHQPYNDFKAYLVREGIKLKDVADLFKCTVQTISMKNNGFSDYTMVEINTICNHFKISSEIFRSKKVS
jgi:hypothetical protein